MPNEVKPIRSEADYRAATMEIAQLRSAQTGTPEADRLDILVSLAEAYEIRHCAASATDPIAAIRLRMAQLGISRRELEPMIGPSSRVSEVLSGKRSLTIKMIRRLRAGLGISADTLIGPSQA